MEIDFELRPFTYLFFIFLIFLLVFLYEFKKNLQKLNDRQNFVNFLECLFLKITDFESLEIRIFPL